MMAKREIDPADDFLGVLERRETALLAWGLPDGSFSDAELDELAERFLTYQRLWDEFSSTDELVKLATWLIVEQALEGEAGDAVGGDYYERCVARLGLERWPARDFGMATARSGLRFFRLVGPEIPGRRKRIHGRRAFSRS